MLRSVSTSFTDWLMPINNSMQNFIRNIKKRSTLGISMPANSNVATICCKYSVYIIISTDMGSVIYARIYSKHVISNRYALSSVMMGATSSFAALSLASLRPLSYTPLPENTHSIYDNIYDVLTWKPAFSVP